MFSTIEEAVQKYRDELCRFKKADKPITARMNAGKGVNVPADHGNFPQRLEGMRQVLGLTPEEVAEIDAEIEKSLVD